MNDPVLIWVDDDTVPMGRKATTCGDADTMPNGNCVDDEIMPEGNEDTPPGAHDADNAYEELTPTRAFICAEEDNVPIFNEFNTCAEVETIPNGSCVEPDHTPDNLLVMEL